ncbi:MAG: pyruvate dehydrogenase (acetyl-transferring) E1 component subunit alpha [Armatimonadetes bacterium]|nr:pyruvate dehydrogenase (acetyl-transferring) E1 component subunit alpha [Armatimonadota bacterium]
MPLAREEQIGLYRKMLLIRRFEDRAGWAYTQDKIGGYLHLYIGQEAVACGFLSAARPDDYVIDAYRDHGHFLARGGDPRATMAELYGRSTGVCRGKGGSMHLMDRRIHFYGGTGIVGAGVGIGVGLAYAAKYRGEDRICLNFFGDGAVNTGLFHESFNLASLWDLPILFICENNLYAMGTSVERSSAVPRLAERACAYAIESTQCDGMDLLRVRECAEPAIARVRETRRPYFVEALTYRYRGHGAADPGTYRTREQVERWRQRDPIGLLEDHLIQQGALTKEIVEQIADEVEDEVEEILRFADESPWPPPEALYEGVFAPAP